MSYFKPARILVEIKKRSKKVFCRKNFTTFKFLPRVLSKFDKIILSVLMVVLIISGFFIWRNHWIRTTHEVPNYGGTYVEGVVGEPKDADKFLSRLTGAGLTQFAENGDIKGDLAESWEIQDDGKTYQFKLRDGYFSSDLAAQIAAQNIWADIEITTPSDNLITFKFKQPFSPFLYASTEPLFNYGPYHITKEEKDRITLESSPSYWQGKPYINKIIVKLFSSDDELIKAAKNGEIMGYLTNSKNDFQMDDSQTYQMKLPRQLNLFFNLNREALKNVDIRRSLRDSKVLSANLNLVLATSESEKNIRAAQNLQKSWKDLGVNIEIKTYQNVTLQRDIIPKRDYDLLLFGQDYGPDPDPYPFWHSSQITESGMNLSNFSNKPADKLLEEARQTFDFNLRNQKYDEFKKILVDQVPLITISDESCYFTISNKIKGITKIYGFAEGDHFLGVSKWYIKSKRVK